MLGPPLFFLLFATPSPVWWKFSLVPPCVLPYPVCGASSVILPVVIMFVTAVVACYDVHSTRGTIGEGLDMKKNMMTLFALLLCLLLASCATSGGQESLAGEFLVLEEAQVPGAVMDLLGRMAMHTRDPWQKAIFEAGAQDVRLDGNRLSFGLKSFDPDLKSLGNYETGDGQWLYDLVANVEIYNIPVVLSLSDGAYEKSLTKEVKAAASTSKKSFANESICRALADRLFPAALRDSADASGLLSIGDEGFAWDTEDGVFSIYDMEAWTPLFRTQTKQTLDTSGGPNRLVLRCSGAMPEKLLETAFKSASDRFAKEGRNSSRTNEEIRQGFLDALAATASDGKVNEWYELPVSFEALKVDEVPREYVEYLKRYDFEARLDELEAVVRELPDLPIMDFPPNGRISGSASGTRIDIQSDNDGQSRYIQLRRWNSDEVVLTAFLRSGNTCTVYAPQGKYYFMIASGEVWYGPDFLFGDEGSYSRSELFEVESSEYYHVVQLAVRENGNFGIYGAGVDEFF